MAYLTSWEHQQNSLGLDDRVAVLHDENNRLEIWPAQGFNAYCWHVAGLDFFYRSPQFFTENRPTRSGFPILFPFPNRIRDGIFTWEGTSYHLPIGDSAKKNAIHGFVCQRAWRVIAQGADADSAWITGEFHGSVDAPETLAMWPADYRLRVTYRLSDHILHIDTEADNPDTKPLPFGIGYHPYFLLAPFYGEQAVLTVSAAKNWELVENLPTGQVLGVDAAHDLRHGQRVASLHLDDVMTDLYHIAFDPKDRLSMLGVVQHPSGAQMLTLWASTDFREMVLHTPPHREAVCLEPYTCTTDAINLSQRGIDAGLRVLQPGEHWHGTIELHLSGT